MPIQEIDRTSTLDPDGAIVCEDTEVEEPGIGGDGEHRQNPAGQNVESDEEEEEDEAPAAAPITSATAASAKTTFGMKRPKPSAKKGNDTYDYEQKYPEDAPYQETAPAARVWRTYEDESRNHDANMVEESRDNVDVLLVFAGLFSAIVTTFVAQTSQSLQPDYAAMSASLLYESVLVQRAIANGSSVNAISPSPLNPTIAFVPATTDVWVNALWFTSLFLSLTTALVAVLVKQWLHHYVALPSGTPRDRLLPVLMHLALAIFLTGLVIFLHPLRVALSWIICAGTVLVYTAYVVATILPILFPQCPYRTPLCDLVYVSLRRTVPRVTWYDKEEFLSSYRERDFSRMFHSLLRVQARAPQSLTTIESEVVQQMSTNLAAEALHWLFSVSSNPTVQSIVVQSIGGLPMASEEKFHSLQRDSMAVDLLQHSLLKDCLQGEIFPVPGMELKLGRLLRYYPRIDNYWSSFTATPDTDSFEHTVAILSNGLPLNHRETSESVRPGAFFHDIASSSSKLPPRCWYHLMIKSEDVFSPLDPDNDDHANVFPLDLCVSILYWLDPSHKNKGLTQDIDSSLVVFGDALPYFLDKIHDLVLPMFSNFVKDPSLAEPSLPQSLRVFVAAVKFMLHRLSLPDMSHFIICPTLVYAVEWISQQTLSSQEATAVMKVLDDILAPFVVPSLNPASQWSDLCNATFLAYPSLTTVAPSACSLRGLRSMIDIMASQWDQTAAQPWGRNVYESDPACRVLTNLLVKRIPVAFTVFRDQCLEFLGTHTFHEASVPMVSAYIAGIFAMQHGSDGAVDEATHIDYLHNPQNLFTACSILAAHGVRNIDRNAIRRDITRLVQLRPRDGAWDECRRKLRDLVQSDGGDFFSKQLVKPHIDELRPLQTDEIQAQKDNIRYAIHVLDDFFDPRTHTVMGRLDRFLAWCLGRKPEDRLEQEQQV
ncbi:uncharacterized protein ARMOST_08142 [Armillaria ostoyae]|uniref:DUF6535 domain-containing protein n=1 Tax=Armillaria ostoyae TaxID=47428 RepID=A0A284R7S5_ARMOS|nr:uncharacterized protein ARMOST_08142 [Armillaria ostoyae]